MFALIGILLLLGALSVFLVLLGATGRYLEELEEIKKFEARRLAYRRHREAAATRPTAPRRRVR
jgi:hypothetical protein